MINQDDWIEREDITIDYKVADILSPVESAEETGTSHMVDFLNPKISEEFRKIINKSPIFAEDESYKGHYHLVCAVMDRLDTCVSYINNHNFYPKSEEDFLAYLMFSCIVIDAIKNILKDIGIYTENDDNLYFRKTCMSDPLNLEEKNCPSDDLFFAYFRALTFAHPFETSRPKFLKEGEVQYSPWVIVNSQVFSKIQDPIGVRIYSNKNNETMDLIISFRILKEYLKSRYEPLVFATEWAKNTIIKEETKWKQQKINRDNPPIEVFREIVQILKSRYEETYEIEGIILYLECKSSIVENNEKVEIFKRAIVNKLTEICNAIEQLDYEAVYSTLDELMYKKPSRMHNGAHYELEKIFTYLREDSYGDNYVWGLEKAKNFSEGFAKKWVIIEPYKMSCTEIKMLARVACYLECSEENGIIFG